jgi:nickel-dependent lactate racemase
VEYSLRFGTDSQITFELDPDFVQFGNDDGTAEESALGEMLRHALAEPQNYPPLSDCVVPGDRIAIAVDPELLEPAPLLSELLDYFRNFEREPAAVTVVLAEQHRTLVEQLSELGKTSKVPLEIVVHDSNDENERNFLMANQDGEAVFINRHLADADLVVPLLSTRHRGALGYRGAFTGIYPTFSDRATQQRFAAAITDNTPERQAAHRGETNEVGFTLGMHFLIVVVPGRSGAVRHVLAGESTEVQHTALKLSEDYWTRSAGEPAEVIVASLSGADARWETIAKVLHQVEPFGTDDAVIVVCSDLKQKPGEALYRLRDLEVDPDATFRELNQEGSTEAVAAIVLARLRESHQIFFISELNRDIVEDLGFGVLDSGEEISRLSRGRTVAIIEDAQFVACEPAE